MFTSVLEEHTSGIFWVKECLLELLFNPEDADSSFL
jgi:hypothetical protein